MIEIIKKRVSRRNYIDEVLNDQDALLIEQIITDINAESGLNFCLMLDVKKAFNGLTKSYGLFKHVNSVIILKGKSSDNLLELCGYYGEKIILEATKHNLGTCFVGGSFDKNFFHYDNEEIVCLITIGYVKESLSGREKIIHSALHSKKTQLLDNVNYDHELNELELLMVEAVKLAPAAKNRNVIQLDFVDEEIIIATPNTYHFDLFDLGVAKYNFEVVANIKFPLGNNAIITHKKRN